MEKIKKIIAVNELKGLLNGLENYIMDARINLTSDNIDDLINTTTDIFEYVKIIEEKVIETNID